jgi:hypothetical protein
MQISARKPTPDIFKIITSNQRYFVFYRLLFGRFIFFSQDLLLLMLSLVSVCKCVQRKIWNIKAEKNGAKNLLITINEYFAQIQILPTVPLHTVPRMFSFSEITYFMDAGLKACTDQQRLIEKITSQRAPCRNKNKYEKHLNRHRHDTFPSAYI